MCEYVFGSSGHAYGMPMEFEKNYNSIAGSFSQRTLDEERKALLVTVNVGIHVLLFTDLMHKS